MEREPAGVDNLIKGNTLYKAFQEWAEKTLPIKETDLREKLRREQEYLDYLVDAMNIGG